MRRLVALLTCVVLSAPVLAACGEEPTTDLEPTGADGIKVAGKIGAAPEVTWDGRMTVDEVETQVVTEGSGPEVKSGDTVLAHLWVGNGYTNELALNTYDANKPEIITVDEELVPGIREAVEGRTIGSRVMVAAPPEDAFGASGSPQLGIGNFDSVLFVVDLVTTVVDQPEGKKSPLPAGMPKLVEKDGVITGWDFAGAEKPGDKLRVITLVEGTGAPVKADSAIVAQYLGQVFKGKKPFDQNYDAEAAVFSLGEQGGLIKGWNQGLVGVKAGSRVALVIPPELGYGKKGNKQAGIKGTDTLYFVLDVLGTT